MRSSQTCGFRTRRLLRHLRLSCFAIGLLIRGFGRDQGLGNWNSALGLGGFAFGFVGFVVVGFWNCLDVMDRGDS